MLRGLLFTRDSTVRDEMWSGMNGQGNQIVKGRAFYLVVFVRNEIKEWRALYLLVISRCFVTTCLNIPIRRSICAWSCTTLLSSAAYVSCKSAYSRSTARP